MPEFRGISRSKDSGKVHKNCVQPVYNAGIAGAQIRRFHTGPTPLAAYAVCKWVRNALPFPMIPHSHTARFLCRITSATAALSTISTPLITTTTMYIYIIRRSM
jgi:hypothetical protein